MKIDRWTGVIYILLLVLLQAFPLFGDIALIPGYLNRVCYYTDFSYNFSADDFFYYLNDRLLFMEKPDGKVEGSRFHFP